MSEMDQFFLCLKWINSPYWKTSFLVQCKIFQDLYICEKLKLFLFLKCFFLCITSTFWLLINQFVPNTPFLYPFYPEVVNQILRRVTESCFLTKLHDHYFINSFFCRKCVYLFKRAILYNTHEWLLLINLNTSCPKVCDGKI